MPQAGISLLTRLGKHKILRQLKLNPVCGNSGESFQSLERTLGRQQQIVLLNQHTQTQGGRNSSVNPEANSVNSWNPQVNFASSFKEVKQHTKQLFNLTGSAAKEYNSKFLSPGQVLLKQPPTERRASPAFTGTPRSQPASTRYCQSS